jgi:hypothetical protein
VELCSVNGLREGGFGFHPKPLALIEPLLGQVMVRLQPQQHFP